jgi:hypothetical protein
LNNDEAIRAAAVELVLREGIDSISFRDVGKIVGLTHGASMHVSKTSKSYWSICGMKFCLIG